MSNLNLTVIINTKNAATTLPQALASVAWVPHVVVVDMHSTDQTVALAKQAGATVEVVADVGYVEPARNQAIAQASTEWVLILDADEEVSVGLAQHLQDILTSTTAQDPEVIAYFLPRQNIIFKRAMTDTGWWPDYQLRLFKKGSVMWSDQIHSVPQVKGKVAYLPAQTDVALKHHNYQTVSQFLQRLDRYTTIESQAQPTPQRDSTQFTPEHFLQAFTDDFIRRYFGEHGYREGSHGVSLALLQAMYQVVSELKKWEQTGFTVPKAEQTPSQIAQMLATWQRTINYWVADWQVHHSSGLKRMWWRWRRKWNS